MKQVKNAVEQRARTTTDKQSNEPKRYLPKAEFRADEPWVKRYKEQFGQEPSFF